MILMVGCLIQLCGMEIFFDSLGFQRFLVDENNLVRRCGSIVRVYLFLFPRLCHDCMVLLSFFEMKRCFSFLGILFALLNSEVHVLYVIPIVVTVDYGSFNLCYNIYI
jgi:hypothetical protein